MVEDSKSQLAAELATSVTIEGPASPALQELSIFEDSMGSISVTRPSNSHKPFSRYGQSHPPVELEGRMGDC